MLLKTFMYRHIQIWTIGKTNIKRLETFDMLCYRRMVTIKWVIRISNEEVLEKIRELRTLWINLKKRRAQLKIRSIAKGYVRERIWKEREEGRHQFLSIFSR